MPEVRYSRLSRRFDTPGEEKYVDLQFIKKEPKVPWRAICSATVLLIIGTVLLIVGSLLVSGHIDAKYNDRTWPVLIIGLLTFIPGFYHVRIAYYAYKKYEGYSYGDIPDYD